MIKIRHYNRKGSETAVYDVVGEAQAVVDAAIDAGALVVDETAEDVKVNRGDVLQEEHDYLVVPAIVGG